MRIHKPVITWMQECGSVIVNRHDGLPGSLEVQGPCGEPGPANRPAGPKS